MHKIEQTYVLESGMWAPLPSRNLYEPAGVKTIFCNIQVTGALKSLAMATIPMGAAIAQSV
jgi:hypothetical protein